MERFEMVPKERESFNKKVLTAHRLTQIKNTDEHR